MGMKKGRGRMFAKFDYLVRFFEEAVCVGALGLIVTLVSIQVFYRYVLFSGILWMNEVVTNLMVLMVMVGAALATRNKVHTDLQVLVGHANQKVAIAIRIFAALVIGLFLLILIYYSALHAFNSRSLTTIMLDIPLWITYGLIPAGGALIFYEFARNALMAALAGSQVLGGE
jgi:TRAP-type C4-dicarboxylate transport system permease small subunit